MVRLRLPTWKTVKRAMAVITVLVTIITVGVAIATYYQTERHDKGNPPLVTTLSPTTADRRFYLSILVRSESTGQPIEGANLTLNVQDDPSYLTAVTDQNGYGLFSLDPKSRGKPAVLSIKDQSGIEHSKTVTIPTLEQSIQVLSQ